MPNRIFPSHTPQKSPQFGLVGWLEQTRVKLPLKGVECRFHVCGDLLNVEIDQIFHQNNPQAMDCLYTFPLPAGAAVYRCEMHVNGRVIRARVEEQAQAQEIARKQKAAGRRTALVEMERENLFTLSLGNVQPGDIVVIRLSYFQTLTRLADWTSLRIPFCPGVRYIPGQPLLRSPRGKGVMDDTDQVPDASRISPPRLDALHPDAAYLSVEGVMENALGTMSEISSASHPVVVTDGDRRHRVNLADQSTVPDCDFALRWTETLGECVQSAAWALRDSAETYALVLLQAPRLTASVQLAPQDFYFLVDRSGSMEGLKWEKAVQSFRAFLHHLGPEDRAWATFFNNQWQDFAEKPLTAREFGADTGLPSLEKLRAEGGTELLPALQHALNVMARFSSGLQTTVILITDGQVGNEQAILAAIGAHPDLRVHTFGIDTAVNDALLSRLAAQQHGSCCLLQPTDDIVGAVTRLGARLRNPVLTSIVASDGWELPEGAVPDLHSEECVSISLKLNSADAKEVVLQGTLSPTGGEGLDAIRKQAFRFPLIERAEPAIRLLWANSRIRRLLNQGLHSAAIDLAKRHNLLCEGAAFIAWDEVEQVAIAQREFYQPSLAKRFLGFRRAAGIAASAQIECAKAPETSLLEDLGQLRHRLSYLMSPLGVADERLKALLSRRPLLDSDKFVQRFGHRLVRWYQRFVESVAFAWLVTEQALVELLMEWAVDGDADTSRRMTALEKLVHELECKAPNPETGLAVAHRWTEESMPVEDTYRARTLTLLDDLARKLAEIRERERNERPT